MSACCSVYDVGDSVMLLAEMRVYGGTALVDPTVTRVRVKPPTGDEMVFEFGVDAELTRQSGKPAGAFQCRIVATVPSTAEDGDWLWRWEATGAVVAAAEGFFKVRESSFA